MEHLPRRIGQEKSIFPPISYLSQEQYDGGPFLDYPCRLGLPSFEDTGQYRLTATLSLANAQIFAAAPPAELEPFFQNWLFFGLLSEVLGDLYSHEDFVTTILDDEKEKTIVTTVKLLSRLEEWESKIAQDKDSLMDVYRHVARCLVLTQACLCDANPAFDDHLKFHLASVAEIVGFATAKACNVAWTDNPRKSLIPIDWGRSISEDFRKSVLLERSNCCPSQMRIVIQDFRSPQSLGFLASCFHEDVAQTYHASCDEFRCQAGDSVTSGQVTRHVSDSCECEFLHADEEKLVDCLEKGCLPLLRVREGSSPDEMSIEVVPSTSSTSYVALSHVWVDGLGNPTATALPRCQLTRLNVLVGNFRHEYLDTSMPLNRSEDAPEMLLWCDTLCCPVASPEGKKMALRHMYRTYDEASAVLVLDRGLVSNRVGGMKVDEACLRIATSRWMTRLWTLQEGALPARTNKLWFQFTKKALSGWTLYEYLVEVSKTDIQRRSVIDSIMGRFHAFTSLFDVQRSEKRGAQMGDVMHGLMYRSVTVPSDEPLIIATLLAFDLNKILESEIVEERMKVLWGIIGTSPSGINKHLLFHMGPKIHERGFRWALQSLLSVDSEFTMRKSDEPKDRGFLAMNGNIKGLVVEFAGFRISIAQPAKGLPDHLAGFNSKPCGHDDRHRLLLKDHQGRWYILKHRLDDKSGRPPTLEEMCAVISALSSPWILYNGSSSLIPNSTKAHHALLVEAGAKNEQQTQIDELTCVEIKSHVGFGHVPTEMNQICQAAYHLAQELASSAASCRWGDLGSDPIDLEDPDYKDILQGVVLELQRLSRSSFAMEALTASGNSADERGSARIAYYMERFYLGIYMQIDEYAPSDRKWCVD
ncbi:MAG: hypothetical protein HETSPECPRED_005269 [Heterodermia speciosa]|uniref:Heterokaryon incompatibility domain-containing protein n=1 Tax=Heterodermia speciosa TaxID=116794 RepID=A0A8H3IQ13_9LECA|nr:MAG: hypothetical protein HETSPECPRED_005269 [Heterodermia speciosa]